MAFNANNLTPLARAVINDVPRTLWSYATNDTEAVVVVGGYFAAVGSTSGNGLLKTLDVILVTADEDGAPTIAFWYVSDAGLGTVVKATAGTIK